MNQFLFDLLPVLLFFIVFKYQGIYAATWVGILSTLVQVLAYRFIKRRWDKMQLVTLAIFIIFGGMTLYFHNPIFVKWKPTILFWLFAVILLSSHFIGKKPLMQSLLEGSLNEQNQSKQEASHRPILLPTAVGKKINLAWVLFFSTLGLINLYIAYQYSDTVWVNFKLYGITALTLIFSFVQVLFLMRYLKP